MCTMFTHSSEQYTYCLWIVSNTICSKVKHISCLKKNVNILYPKIILSWKVCLSSLERGFANTVCTHRKVCIRPQCSYKKFNIQPNNISCTGVLIQILPHQQVWALPRIHFENSKNPTFPKTKSKMYLILTLLWRGSRGPSYIVKL